MPRILYLCSSWPLGQSFGGQLRALHVGRALRQFGRVTVLVVSSDAGDGVAHEKTAAEFDVLTSVLPQLSSARGLGEKIRRAVDPRHINVHGFVVCEEDKPLIAAAVEEHDLVWILNSRTPNLVGRWHWPRTHLDIDDVPSTYAHAEARSAVRLVDRIKARVQSRLLRRRERLLPERFTTLSTCSDADKAYLGGDDRFHVIPNGFARPAAEPAQRPISGEPRIGFIGLLSYRPNAEGLRWFLARCWPEVCRRVPGIRLRIIGQGAEPSLAAGCEAVDLLGSVGDPAAEFATWNLTVVPLLAGAGTRIKIAEAFSRKCPVVSTPLGAYGYPTEDGRLLRLGESPAEFSRACVEVISDPALAAAMAERAWAAFLQNWTWDAIAPRVHAAAEDCLRRSKLPKP